MQLRLQLARCPGMDAETGLFSPAQVSRTGVNGSAEPLTTESGQSARTCSWTLIRLYLRRRHRHIWSWTGTRGRRVYGDLFPIEVSGNSGLLFTSLRFFICLQRVRLNVFCGSGSITDGLGTLKGTSVSAGPPTAAVPASAVASEADVLRTETLMM